MSERVSSGLKPQSLATALALMLRQKACGPRSGAAWPWTHDVSPRLSTPPASHSHPALAPVSNRTAQRPPRLPENRALLLPPVRATTPHVRAGALVWLPLVLETTVNRNSPRQGCIRTEGGGPGTQKFVYPPPPLQTPGLARDGLPGGGGRRSPSDGLPGGGGRLQGYFKANCGTLH